MLNGVINVYKEEGFTSNDAVAKLRGILRMRKIGHAGTLDPAAVGVLPVLLGSACRISEYMTEHTKSYRASLRLGVTTDTQDMTGQILSERPYGHLTEEEIISCLKSFTGGYEQVPPMYSAKKVDGVRLYDLARQGKEVERSSVFVGITSMEIEEISLPYVTFSVECSKGTYIRTLCHDAGQRLGTGGAMEKLIRTRVGDFRIEEALTLSEIEKARDAGALGKYIIPTGDALGDLPSLRADERTEKLIRNGNPVAARALSYASLTDGEKVRLYLPDGSFAGLYRYEASERRLKPLKMLFDL